MLCTGEPGDGSPHLKIVFTKSMGIKSLAHHGIFLDSKFRSSLFKGLRIPKAAPLVANRSGEILPENVEAQNGYACRVCR